MRRSWLLIGAIANGQPVCTARENDSGTSTFGRFDRFHWLHAILDAVLLYLVELRAEPSAWEFFNMSSRSQIIFDTDEQHRMPERPADPMVLIAWRALARQLENKLVALECANAQIRHGGRPSDAACGRAELAEPWLHVSGAWVAG